MSGNGFLHLYLDGTVLRIYIVEHLFTGFTGIKFDFIVEILIDVLQNALLGYLEAKIVQSGEVIFYIHAGNSLFKS